ncbi:MAG: OFA family MFS transporter [Bryobacteraceae bacterium]
MPSPINRWFIPLAAVLIHISIGSVYAWSTFNKPINAILHTAADAWFKAPYITFSTALILLGLSAAFGGPWVEHNGPRKTALFAAGFFCTGLVVGALGLSIGSAPVVFLGMGLICGIGCGLGYIAPVSTLVKWFPDRRGMATGFAVMGFGGGAFVAGKLNVYLMDQIGIVNGLYALAAAYLVLMITGAAIIRRPPPGWKPAGFVPLAVPNQLAAEASLNRNQSLATPQFWIMWGILFINVTAGIGILSQASPMMQDIFNKKAIEAAAVVSIISLFNAGGRLFWATASDWIGRRNTYIVFFVVQAALFLLIPRLNHSGAWLAFELSLFVIFTIYGGGFATIPAFLADMFGPNNVGAIHGALLTSWSAAAIVGPVIITYLSDEAKSGLAANASKAAAYDLPLRILAVLLVIGFLLTIAVRPLKSRYE